MRRTFNHSEPVADTGQVLAFAGLGHCLEPVRAVARMHMVRWAKRPEQQCMPQFAYDVPRLAGYGLLVALGREIRGR